MKKSITIFLLAILCVFNVMTPDFAYAENEFDSGFEPSEYSEAISLINDLSLISDNYFMEYDASLEMSRGEFAALAVSVIGMYNGGYTESNSLNFDDVPVDHKYFNEINTAVSLGFFNGTSQRTFSPDASIDINQAIKVAVTMLGYKEMAEYKGGYPAGYISVANNLKILDNVVLKNDVPALRGNVIVLIYNTLLADVMDINGIKGDSYSYKITEGVNLLAKYHHIFQGEGVVTANWQYSISGDTEEENYIVINDNRFFTQSIHALNSVGKNVKYYYKNNNNKYTLITLREENNNVVNIKADKNYSFDYANGRYTVSLENKDYTFIISNYDVVYNYGYVSGNTIVDFEKLLYPKNGTITLIDNNDDKVYDVVIIEEPEILLYKTYDYYSDVIYDNMDSSKKIVLDNFTNTFIFDKYGNEVDFSKLEKNSVIMVYESYDSKTLKLVICTDYIEGKVDEISEDGVLISSQLYEFSSVNRLNVINYGNVIYPGNTYKFYLDQYNRIVYHDEKSALYTGYVAKIAYNNNGIGSEICTQIYTTKNKLEVFPLANTVKIETINNRASYNKSEIASKLSDFANKMYGTGINPNSRLFVQYTLNKDGYITSFMLPHVLKTQEEYENPPSNYSFFKLDYIISKFADSGVKLTDANGNPYYRLGYVPANKSAGLTMTFDTSCSIFYVPELSNIDYTENHFALKQINSIARNTPLYYFTDFNGGMDNLEAYSTDREVRLVNSLVWHKVNGHATSISNSAEDNALVTGVSTVKSDDGDTLVKISVLESKSKYDLYSYNPDIITRAVFEDTTLTGHNSTVVTPVLSPNKSKIVPGDLIKFSLNAEGYVEDIALMYDSENNVMSYKNANAFTKHSVQYRHTCGEVIDIYGDYALLNVYDTSETQKTQEPHIPSSYFRIYVYDYKTEEGRVGTAKDISIGDKVYLTMYYTLSTDGELIIYKGGK